MHVMYFHLGVESTILFAQWQTSNWVGIVGSAIGICLMAIIYEGLKNYREYLFANAAILQREELKNQKQPSMFGGVHLFQTILHMVQIIIGYFLMLIFMTYNLYLCIAVTVGGGIGYWLFAWRKTDSDITACCN